jgi:hypothetical protein
MNIFDNHSVYNSFINRNGYSEKNISSSPSCYVAFIQIKKLLIDVYKQNKDEIFAKIKGRKRKSTNLLILDESQCDDLMDEYIAKIETYSITRLQEFEQRAIGNGYYETILNSLYKMSK